MSYERAAELFEDLFSVPLSPGTLVNIDRTCAERLEGVAERIKQNIIASSIAHFDETGMRIEGKLHWLHVAGTKELAFIYEQYAQKWAKSMIDFLLEVKEKREKSRRRGFDPETIKEYENRYRFGKDIAE